MYIVHPRIIFWRSVVHSCFPCSNSRSAWASKRRCPPRSCSITWHSFSPWHNLNKLSSAHGLPKALLLVVKVVQVVFYVSTSNHSIFQKNLMYCTCCPKRCFPHVSSVAFPHAPKRFSSKISPTRFFFVRNGNKCGKSITFAGKVGHCVKAGPQKIVGN